VDISVVIPALNGGRELERCLDAIGAQEIDAEVEVVVVDSGSSDGTPGLARSRGAVVVEISRSSFSHGGARNIGAGRAEGEVLVFTVQDAYAEGRDWLVALITPLRDDPSLAGVYSRQLPHAGARPSEEYFLDFLYGPEPRDQRVADASGLTMAATLFSNVSSAIPRRIWDRFPFSENVPMSEDQEWSARVLLAGYHLRYEPKAVVRHSHDYSLRSAFRRFFDSGVSADRAYLAAGRESRRTLLANAYRYGRGELSWLVRTGNTRAIPFTTVFELTKFTALQLGARHERLPISVKRRLTAFPEQWG
jgi:rhamnosyltransferase